MKTTLDTDEILFKVVKDAFTGLNLNGGVYRMQRPLNSTKEDVVVNTITLSQDSSPQLGASNVNIHVPYMLPLQMFSRTYPTQHG